ncbi:unnamed protein product [Ostreobium quekettii]|uniref:Uncharacterized protein n=1 Tax=Ostreobium quekettii TaxID=121088 RepID=A0A8S1IMY8_9CHLO|nr:unnamed protein product [Ostreobium quekettii]
MDKVSRLAIDHFHVTGEGDILTYFLCISDLCTFLLKHLDSSNGAVFTASEEISSSLLLSQNWSLRLDVGNVLFVLHGRICHTPCTRPQGSASSLPNTCCKCCSHL